MPTPIERQSLDMSLEDRYNTQHVGGAFDAKKDTPDIFGFQEKMWTKAGFTKGGNEQLGVGGRKKYDKSIYNQGISTKKYKP